MYHYRNAIRSKLGMEGVVLIRETNSLLYRKHIKGGMIMNNTEKTFEESKKEWQEEAKRVQRKMKMVELCMLPLRIVLFPIMLVVCLFRWTYKYDE